MIRKSPKQLALIDRRRRVSELRLRGWTQRAIAAELGMGRATVSSDLRAVRREWQETMVDDCAKARAEELEKLAQVEREAWAAWERSQQPNPKHATEAAFCLSQFANPATQTAGPSVTPIIA